MSPTSDPRFIKVHIIMPFRLLPYLFVLLWSSAFVSAKVGVFHASPFAFLFVRFLIVFVIFVAIGLVFSSSQPNLASKSSDKEPLALTILTGLLLHGGYLGASFYAMASGLGSALTALIVSTQPLLTTALAVFLFHEKPRPIQWLGILIGFVGVVVALSPALRIDTPIEGIIASLIGLITITIGTLIHKRISGRMSLVKSNAIQALAASCFFLVLIQTVETPRIEWHPDFIFALMWQVFAVSTGAYVILMILIKRGTMTATTSLLFLVPPTTAIIANLALQEPLGPVTILGFALASAGVYLVTRYQAKTP